MPTLDQVSNLLYNNFEGVTERRKGNGIEFNARCPLCGDSKKSKSKKRFNLNFIDSNDIKWHCFNCDMSGGFYKLYSLIEGIDEKEAYKIFNTYNEERIKEVLSPKRKKVKQNKTEKQHNFNYILNDCVSVKDEKIGYLQKQYQDKLKSFIYYRKIRMDVYAAYKGDYKGRFIIPIIEKGNIVYFQGRRIFDDMEPKYKNPAIEKGSIILNRYNFDKSKHIIITEGMLDADTVGYQGTSIIGKNLSEEFLCKVKSYTHKKVILVMDNDNDGLDKIEEYSNKYKDILYFVMPKQFDQCKDINDLVVFGYINRDSVYDFIVDNSYKNIKARVKIVIEKKWRR